MKKTQDLIKNPFLNALWAGIYILVIVKVISVVASVTALHETIFIPIVLLSLFVLSAAVMGFLFVYEPLKLFLENHRAEAVKFFFKTVITFAVVSLIFLAVLLVVSKKDTKKVTYLCDAGRSIIADFYIPKGGKLGKVRVTIGNEEPTNLNQTVSGSGIRYANQDESLVFWSKGNEALIMRNNAMDMVYTNCHTNQE